MNIAQLLEDLRAQRTGLEWEYAGRRSQIDKVISRIEREVEVAVKMVPAKLVQKSPLAWMDELSPPTPPQTTPRKAKPQSNGKPEPKAPGRRSPEGTIAQRLREWVAEHTGEWTTKEVQEALKATRSAVSCAVDKLLKAGLIERVGKGTYKSTGQSVREQYAQLRSTMKITNAPEVQTAVGRGEE